MTTQLLPLAALLLPAIGGVIVLLLNGRVAVRRLVPLVVVLLLLAAGAALLPRWGWPARTQAMPWLDGGVRPIDTTLRWDGGRDLLMVLVLLLGAGSIVTYGRHTGGDGAGLALPVAGILLLVTGSCLAVGAGDGLVAVAGVGLAGLGGLLAELSSTPQDNEPLIAGIMPLVAGSTILAAAAMWDATLVTTAPVWAVGCLVLLLSGVLRLVQRRVPSLLRAPVALLGVPLLGATLLVQSVTSAPDIWSPAVLAACSLGGAALLVGGAVWALTAQRLAAILGGQWLAQLGLVGLALGSRGPALALLLHATWSSAVMAWALAALETAAGTDRIADLPPFARPLRRTALIYGVAAGSALGLPLLAGYRLHVLLSEGLAGPFTAVVLGAEAALALALLAPLVACLRRPAVQGGAGSEEAGSLPALLGALALVVGTGRATTRLLLHSGSEVVSLRTIGGEAVQIAAALVVLALVSRRLRQPGATGTQPGGEPQEDEPGWALPWSGLRDLLLADHREAWQAALDTGRQRLAALGGRAEATTGRLTRRYYVSLVVAIVVVVLLAVAGGGGR